jgi:hypothetical protein
VSELKPYAQTIWVVAKQQYGRWVYYPRCKKAKLFAKIAGTETITAPVLLHIKALGFDVQTELAQPEGEVLLCVGIKGEE